MNKFHWFIILGKKLSHAKQIDGLKIVNIDNSKSNITNARISWRPVSMTSKKLTYTLSWVPKDCTDNSKELRVKTRVSLIYRNLNSDSEYYVNKSKWSI